MRSSAVDVPSLSLPFLAAPLGAAVEPAAYPIESDGTRVRVTPRTPGGRTDGALQGRAVTVKGCVRTLEGEKRITWAEIDG